MATETVRITGLSEALRMLEGMPADIVSKRGGPVRAALRKAAVILQKEAQANVQRIMDTPNIGGPDRATGTLKKNIGVRRAKPIGFRGEVYLIDVRGRARYPVDRAGTRFNRVRDVAFMLELGTERREPIPFMRPAFDAKRVQAVETFKVELFKAIDRAYRKIGR